MSQGIPSEPRQTPLPVGVNLAGFFDGTRGIAEAARQVRGALEAAGVAVAQLPLAERGATPAPVSAPQAPFPITVVCTNAHGIGAAREQLGPAPFDGRRVIGLWWWEVMAFPGRWRSAFDQLDEIWVGSRFVADLLAGLAPVPVINVPLPLRPPPAAQADRASLGLPPGFLFGFAFDHDSVTERKNPLGLIEAFDRAFPPATSEDVALVIKTLNGERHRDDHAAVVAAAATHPAVQVIERRLEERQMKALLGTLDCYVSLHRAEGFGLTIAEAMLQGVPVIATDYGGSRDFVTAFNAFLVDFRLVPIGPGHDPYPADGEWAEPDLDDAARLLRRVLANPAEARARGARAREEIERQHAPAAAGRAMAERVARLLEMPERPRGRVDALDLTDARRRLNGDPSLDTTPRGRARDVVRRLAVRAMRPYAVHQRLVDEELLRAIRTLDDRVRGIAAAQSVLAAELALRRAAANERSPATAVEASEGTESLTDP